jgi:hypothetical protein
MRKREIWVFVLIGLLVTAASAMAAYHHEGEDDSDRFLQIYPDKTGSKLDHCALCHSGGEYEKKENRLVQLGSCQWCHRTYGYDGSGNILDTLNTYGMDYRTNGSSASAITTIDNLDSDADGYTNREEILAGRFPGDADDHPGLIAAPYRVYTKTQLMALGSHSQFMLMNTSRSGDFYAQYTGIALKDLLDDAGVSSTATGIRVYAPDGWSQDHPMAYDADLDMYHVYGNTPGQEWQYPPATHHYKTEADKNQNPVYGWCDYSAPSCTGRTNGDTIHVEGGLKAILAYARESAPLEPGILSAENKLDGEGPFRVVVPQKFAGPPDQSSKADYQPDEWAYNSDWDHNAGSCTRSATIIKVEPLPAGTTDINVLEAGWSYVDQEKIIIYGAIDGTDSNGNGILDSEEGTDATSDLDGDGIPDYRDPDTASPRHVKGADSIRMHTSAGQFAAVQCMAENDPGLPSDSLPSGTFPYGVTSFTITGLAPEAQATVTLEFSSDVPASASYYQVDSSGSWAEMPHTAGDNARQMKIQLTDGDATADSDGAADGSISALGAMVVSQSSDGDKTGGGAGCFISIMDRF